MKKEKHEVFCGVDVISKKGIARQGKCGLITNHTGVLKDLSATTAEVLQKKCDLCALFGPEHGLYGAIQAGAETGEYMIDKQTGLPVYSLYGKGKMKAIFASDSDVVFATVAEEWGLVLAVMLVLCIVILALFSLRSARWGRSSFYVIGGCTASAILLVQTIFNVLGTVDVLPLTGVTFPFLSNGGSSMLSVWGLLAFIKAADTRQNGSFAVKLPARREPDA